jgi:DNA-binding protein HU-beta
LFGCDAAAVSIFFMTGSSRSPGDLLGLRPHSRSTSAPTSWRAPGLGPTEKHFFQVLCLNVTGFASINCALMTKALTKSQIATSLAEQVGVTKKQSIQALDLLAELAYKQAKNTFTVPGIGKLVLVNRPARTMTMQFGPKKGQTIKVSAKRVVKFRVAKAAKDAILGGKK